MRIVIKGIIYITAQALKWTPGVGGENKIGASSFPSWHGKNQS